MFQALLRAVMFAVRQRRELDRAPHVAGIVGRSGQLIERLVPPFHQRRGDQGHAAAHHVHRNHVQALALVRGQLPEIGPQQIRKRRGSIDAFIPSSKRLLDGCFHDRRPHDGDGQACAARGEQRLRQALGEGIGVGPAQPAGTPHGRAREAISYPAHPVLADQFIDLAPRRLVIAVTRGPALGVAAPPPVPALCPRASIFRINSSSECHSRSALNSSTFAGV